MVSQYLRRLAKKLIFNQYHRSKYHFQLFKLCYLFEILANTNIEQNLQFQAMFSLLTLIKEN